MLHCYMYNMYVLSYKPGQGCRYSSKSEDDDMIIQIPELIIKIILQSELLIEKCEACDS